MDHHVLRDDDRVHVVHASQRETTSICVRGTGKGGFPYSFEGGEGQGKDRRVIRYLKCSTWTLVCIAWIGLRGQICSSAIGYEGPKDGTSVYKKRLLSAYRLDLRA